MIALAAIISGANPISAKRRPRADVDLATPRADTFARVGRYLQSSDGNALRDAWRRCAAWEDVAPGNAGRPPIEKARGRFPARALKFLR